MSQGLPAADAASIWQKTAKGKPAIGSVAERARRTSMADVEMFSAMTGNMNPLHCDAKLATPRAC